MIAFRPCTGADLPLVAAWQARPHVARWWGEGADPALTGHGLGRSAIALFTRLAFDRYPRVDLVAVAVRQDNIASWRALDKAGYQRRWAGELAADDPSDQGPMYLYGCDRAARGAR